MSNIRIKSSPWANDDSQVSCPRCNSRRVIRIMDSWGRNRGVQMFKCASCNKKFYERGLDDYRPTFIR
ncbi:MAG: transposase [Candidatus Thorarchaeota archaeon]